MDKKLYEHDKETDISYISLELTGDLAYDLQELLEEQKSELENFQEEYVSGVNTEDYELLTEAISSIWDVMHRDKTYGEVYEYDLTELREYKERLEYEIEDCEDIIFQLEYKTKEADRLEHWEERHVDLVNMMLDYSKEFELNKDNVMIVLNQESNQIDLVTTTKIDYAPQVGYFRSVDDLDIFMDDNQIDMEYIRDYLFK